MTYDTLISPEQLRDLNASGASLMVFDCSFDLGEPEAGVRHYRAAHIPGAVYAHLEDDLSARHGAPSALAQAIAAHEDEGEPASGGRHPLPSREKIALWLSSIGFTNDMQAVVYDRNGLNFGGRLWWMLQWMGHEAAAVLDGGLQGWQSIGGQVVSGEEPARFQSNFVLGAPRVRLADTRTVAAHLETSAQTLIDARAPARYRGDVEPLDPVAGHIPGALNRPFSDNFDADGRFKPPAQLRAEFESLLAGRDPATIVNQCGSGVSALPNLIALRWAGLGTSALYAGSWSEWCNTPGLPARQGAAP
ncbi:MAG: sulfurtransferase [Burkholderiaceae bacterium]|jgi:thiosulfate/3-mercaptopyruvate sulfurtransferase|nr:sulfurtransferase [Burkholderiaceae bacterium]